MNRSLRLNVIAGAFGMFWLCAPLGAPLPLLMQAVDASATQLGLLSAAWQIATLAQIPAAFLAETMPRRKPLWAFTAILHRILWATPAVLPWLLPQQRALWPIILIAALGLSNLLANTGTASWQSWMADIVPSDSAGRFWSIRQMILSVFCVIATACYGWVLDYFSHGEDPFRGFQWVFLCASLLGIADIVVHCFVHEPLHRRPQVQKKWKERFYAPFQNSGFTLLTFAMAGWIGAQAMLGYTMALPGFFSMVHLRETFGASYSQASFIFIAACLGAALFTPWLGPWMDRVGAETVLPRMLVLGPLTMAGWWFARSGEWTLGHTMVPQAIVVTSFAALLQGAVYTGAMLCQFRLTQIYTPAEGRIVAMAIHWSIAGVGGAIGAMLAGFMKDHLPQGDLPYLPGHWRTFDLLVLIHAVVVWSLVLPLCKKLQREAGVAPTL